MQEGKKDWRQRLHEIRGKKDQWLILLLTGILLLVIAMPSSEGENGARGEAGEEAAATDDRSGESLSLTDDSYVRNLERRLEQALARVEGVGNVSVMITFSSSAEKVVEKDREITSQTESAAEGNGRSTDSSSVETSVYSGEGGDEIPYIKKELSPEIEGVLVVADGGGNAVVVENITGAVQALFGVDTHKIKVMKRS